MQGPKLQLHLCMQEGAVDLAQCMLDITIPKETDSLSIAWIEQSFVTRWSVQPSTTVSFSRIPEIVWCIVYN